MSGGLRHPRPQIPLARPLGEALDKLPQSLRQHIERVRDNAWELAVHHGMDAELADQAAAAHDIARAMSGQKLLNEARKIGLGVSSLENRLPILLHGPVGANLAQLHLGVTEPHVLEAIHWHSTAAPGLSPLGKLIFLADKLDHVKWRRYPFIETVRARTLDNLDQGLVLFLSKEIERLLAGGGLIHPMTLEARNELLLKMQSR